MMGGEERESFINIILIFRFHMSCSTLNTSTAVLQVHARSLCVCLQQHAQPLSKHTHVPVRGFIGGGVAARGHAHGHGGGAHVASRAASDALSLCGATRQHATSCTPSPTVCGGNQSV